MTNCHPPQAPRMKWIIEDKVVCFGKRGRGCILKTQKYGASRLKTSSTALRVEFHSSNTTLATISNFLYVYTSTTLEAPAMTLYPINS